MAVALATVGDAGSLSLDLLKEAGVSTSKVKSEVQKFRRKEGKKVESASGNTLDPVISRDEEIRKVIMILPRETKNDPVLIEEPGMGKTAVVERLAQKIVRGGVPSNLAEVRPMALDMGALVAGAKYRGEVRSWP
ncbi:chaperone protein ClpB1-like [Vitis vinifera]|nr:chaperone protein ClpB1-like [Vitis vinifera]|eukprot:XP_019081516.1 PREDICTED: chaperone protein ClpB1-like [Vitis vinifera]